MSDTKNATMSGADLDQSSLQGGADKDDTTSTIKDVTDTDTSSGWQQFTHHVHRYINLAFLFLELHMPKFVIFFLMLVCIYDKSALYLFLVFLIVLACAFGRPMQTFAIYTSSIFVSLMLLARMIYQTDYIDPKNWNVTCEVRVGEWRFALRASSTGTQLHRGGPQCGLAGLQENSEGREFATSGQMEYHVHPGGEHLGGGAGATVQLSGFQRQADDEGVLHVPENHGARSRQEHKNLHQISVELRVLQVWGRGKSVEVLVVDSILCFVDLSDGNRGCHRVPDGFVLHHLQRVVVCDVRV